MEKLKQTPAWINLEHHAPLVKRYHMRDMFVADKNRATKYSLDAAGIHLDYSKNRVTQEVLDNLFDLATQRQLAEKISAMFSGKKINTTENRAVLHTALRNFSDKPVMVDGENVMPQVKATLTKMEQFTVDVHSGKHTGYTGKAIKKVVSIGIGGSFLGPKIVTEALKPYWHKDISVVFVANVDGCHIHDVLNTCDIEETLFVMSSKSFGTQETLQNTLSAKAWFLNNGGNQNDIAKHFVAVSSNVKAAVDFGMAEQNVFPMADWVGGRYSLWSAIGLPICLALGYQHFEALLHGAYDMDCHFQSAPFDQNMPVILAMLGIWYRNFMGAQSHALLPYYHYLRGLPAYVQQLDMESNGKIATLDGRTVDHGTGPIIWGSEGSNGQHSFYQLIHQSNLPIPADFMFPINVPSLSDEKQERENQTLHHQMLASNCFGQTQALMQGKSFEECYKDLDGKGLSDDERHTLAAHKTMAGNNPSNTLVFDTLNPKTLGALIAMYEHKVYVQGCIWGLNSFDQWGVELGKVLGNQVLDMIQGKSSMNEADASTQALIKRFLQQ
ncbi:glucose-6-phosphate isomerase [Glaciecola petra]|uniref:Glucose-6-phosphate isomerase n=1 Tax=Glaciecola petra TaxID=3075602 RepID=A0ABU2ZM20_9ALTE|nr:glucose-6-phosphate isomerase [Aestuariibacter sp. P117]MDT0593450.1 glucose-6-phosphate isomerase [Aestuariibacter sp. P117]